MASAHLVDATNVVDGSTSAFAIRYSAPIVGLAVFASAAGIFVPRIYENETANWAAQAVAQDIANIVVFTALYAFAVLAGRGSLRYYLLWLGTLVYSVYAFAIYSFAAHFGPLFLVYVAVFGLSVATLIIGFMKLDFEKMRREVSIFAPMKGPAYLLMGIGGAFYLMWLGSIIPPMLSGITPDELVETGLLTNPVHVLDLALFLPAMILAGTLLLRGNLLGFALGPVLLTAALGLSLGIVVTQPVMAVRGEEAMWGVAVAVVLAMVAEGVALSRLLKAVSE